MYWEGPMPGYIQLCVRTVRRCYQSVRLLDRASFDAVQTKDRDVPIDHLGPHHRADFVRAYLLARHGGLWLDADFILLRPLTAIFELPEQYTFCAYQESPDQYANGLLYSRRDDVVAHDYYERVRTHLLEGRPIDWLEIGAYALTPAVSANRDRVYTLPQQLINPIPWNDTWRYEQPGDPAELLEPQRLGLMMSNSSMSADTKAMSPAQVLASATLLGAVLRRVLGQTAAPHEAERNPAPLPRT
jgi:hypothetical protein